LEFFCQEIQIEYFQGKYLQSIYKLLGSNLLSKSILLVVLWYHGLLMMRNTMVLLLRFHLMFLGQ